MSDAGDWHGEVGGADVTLLEDAPGGALSDIGRQAAVEAALGLLGVYFAAGEQSLVDRSAGARSIDSDQVDIIQAGLRLRVALAASNRLLRILGEIVDRPTFRYELRSVEQVGALSGALDVNRWLTRSRGGDQELTYPVLEVRRAARTPENVLAAYAIQWLKQELRGSLSMSLATPSTVEYRAVRRQGERLDVSAQLPTFSLSASEARDIRNAASLSRLIGQVRRRLQRREIPNSKPYRELVKWIASSLDGHPTIEAGEIDLALYGVQFDNKLFELWCLGLLGRELAGALNLPEPPINRRWRQGEPAYALENFSGRIEIFFQRSLGALSSTHQAHWVKDDGRRLGGIPDIVIRATPLSGEERLAVLDPKLRQRDRLPAEELYKILGYLHNFAVEPAIGGVLIYTTNGEPIGSDVFHDGDGGTLMSASLNPAASAETNHLALREVIATIVGLIDARPMDPLIAGGEGDASDQAETTVDVTRMALASWGNSHPNEIRPSQERIETLVGEERWAALDSDVQIMMATADLVGHQLDGGADFSGPVLGMCASVEHLIYTTVVLPAVSGNKEFERQTRTFGSAVDAIDLALRNRGGAVPKAIRLQIDQVGLDLKALAALLPSWRRLNTGYRVPAAHRELLSRATWQQVYRLLIGADTLFARTYDALHVQP